MRKDKTPATSWGDFFSSLLAAASAIAATIPASADTLVFRTDDLLKSGAQILGEEFSLTLAADAKTPSGRARIASAYLGKGSNFWGGNKTLATQCVVFSPNAIVNAPTAPGTASGRPVRSIAGCTNLRNLSFVLFG